MPAYCVALGVGRAREKDSEYRAGGSGAEPVPRRRSSVSAHWGVCENYMMYHTAFYVTLVKVRVKPFPEW